MSIFKDVLRELFSMFVGDARLTVSILVLVCLVALMLHRFDLSPLLCGSALLIGCLAILVESVLREGRNRRQS